MNNNFLKITAFWAFTEGILGGILHSFKLPFTSIFIVATAVLWISLLAKFAEKRSDILQSLIIVLILKMVLSPHASIMAHIAVIFQGLLGYFLFKIIKSVSLTVFFLSVLSMLESALQKVLVNFFFYQKSFQAVWDVFLEKLIRDFDFFQNVNDLVFIILTIYIGVYFVVGVLVTFLVIKIIKEIEILYLEEKIHFSLEQKTTENTLQNTETDVEIAISAKKNIHKNLHQSINKNSKKTALIATFLLLLGTLFFTFYLENFLEKNYFPKNSSSHILMLISGILLRMITLFFFLKNIIGEFLLYYLKNFLEKHKNKYTSQILQILEYLPKIKENTLQIWSEIPKNISFYQKTKFFILKFVVQ